MYDGYANRYSVTHNGRKITLIPLSPKDYLLITANLKRKGKRVMQKKRLKKNQVKKRA